MFIEQYYLSIMAVSVQPKVQSVGKCDNSHCEPIFRFGFKLSCGKDW